MKKSIIGFSLALAVMILFILLPEAEGLTGPAQASIGLLIAGIILWVTEALPLAITTFLLMILMPYLGVMELSSVWKEFISPVFFFVLATFAMTAALLNTKIPNRIAGLMLRWSGNSSKKLVLGFVFATAALSAIMSNVPTAALFMGLGIAILKANGDPTPGTSNLGKCLMIGIAYGSVMGGFSTPAGSAINIMALHMLKDATGIWIRFLDWMMVGIPMAIIGVFVVSWWITLVHKPEPISSQARAESEKILAEAGKLDIQEKKVLAIIGLMFIFWISSTWFPIIDTTVVAVAGMCLFFFPGIKVLTWKEFVSNSSWEALIMIGGIQSIAAGLVNTGAASWLVNTVMAGAAFWPGMVTNVIASALTSLLHVIIPTGPAVVGLALVAMVEVAGIASLSAASFAMITAFWSNVTYLLPIDTVPLITFGKGYYKMSDMIKAGIVPNIIMILVAALLVPALANLLGY